MLNVGKGIDMLSCLDWLKVLIGKMLMLNCNYVN